VKVSKLLQDYFEQMCPEIHMNRLQAVMDVATGLQKSQNLSLTQIGRALEADTSQKHRIKKVDRLVGNQHLYHELGSLYNGLSSYIFNYISQDKTLPLVIDLCYMKDSNSIQMLSAEVALKGRSLPIYREVFEKNELKKRAPSFIKNLSKYIPSDREVMVIMDAGFGDEWFDAIDQASWYWLVRARGKKFIKLDEQSEWTDARELYSLGSSRTKHYPDAMITKGKERPCRVVIKKQFPEKKVRKKPKKLPRNYNSANGNYSRTAKEPWVLATNAPKKYSAMQMINYYKKRMQIEESFRDLKSHQFGLKARYIRSESILRWGILMLLAAIVQVMIWTIGVVGHYHGLQSYFQSNTVRDKKVFSYFYLGQLMVQFDKMDIVYQHFNNLEDIIAKELARDW
jgi:Transposase DDE domain